MLKDRVKRAWSNQTLIGLNSKIIKSNPKKMRITGCHRVILESRTKQLESNQVMRIIMDLCQIYLGRKVWQTEPQNTQMLD